MVKEEEMDLSVMSTYEIKMAFKKKRKLRKEQEKKHEDVTAFIRKMTAKEIQNFLVLDCPDTTTMKVRILQLKAMQNIEHGYYNLLQIHGYIKFNEESRMKVFLKECITPRDSTFINRLVKYSSQHCYTQSSYENILKWTHMMATRNEYDWVKAFNNSVLSSPERETELLAGQIMFLPNPSTKNANRVLAAIAKQNKLPACFELLIKIIFKHADHSTLTKSDVEVVMRIYLHGIFEQCYKWKRDEKKRRKEKSSKEKEQSVEQLAQAKFLEMSSQLANQTFGILQKSDKHAAQMLLHDPAFEMEKPSNLFVEYFLQYSKLGLFGDRSEKLIAWNYYYDDRWCGYDRSDLFGDNFIISDRDVYCTDFRFAGTIEEHPYHAKLSLTARVYGWMSADPDFFARMIEKYGGDDMLQYFAVSLSFANMFKEVRDLYETNRENIVTRYTNFSLALCYMYSCAKEGMAKEAFQTWASIMKHATRFKYLKTLKFQKDSFPLPFFVKIDHVAQFATRLLRNCMFTAALKDGTEAWKKYGFILLTLCNLMESTFLNHNMIRIIFQKIPLEDMHLLIRPGLLKCFRDNNAYTDCLYYARSRGYEIPACVINECMNLDQWANKDYTPGFIVFFNRLKELNEVFYPVMDDLPVKTFVDVKEDMRERIHNLSAENQETINNIIDFNVEKANKLEEQRKERERLAEEKEKRIIEEIERSYELRQTEELLLEQRLKDQEMGITSKYYSDDEEDYEPYIDPEEFERIRLEEEEEQMRLEEMQQEEAMLAYDTMMGKRKGESMFRPSHLDRLKDVVEKLPNYDEPEKKKRRRSHGEQEEMDEMDEMEEDLVEEEEDEPSDSDPNEDDAENVITLY